MKKLKLAAAAAALCLILAGCGAEKDGTGKESGLQTEETETAHGTEETEEQQGYGGDHFHIGA